MRERKKPLKEGEHGSYADLAVRPLPEGLVFLFTPSLAALFTRAEEIMGSTLTAEQAIRIRDGALAVITAVDAATATIAERGYADVDPTDVLQSWQTVRQGSE